MAENRLTAEDIMAQIESEQLASPGARKMRTIVPGYGAPNIPALFEKNASEVQEQRLVADQDLKLSMEEDKKREEQRQSEIDKQISRDIKRKKAAEQGIFPQEDTQYSDAEQFQIQQGKMYAEKINSVNNLVKEKINTVLYYGANGVDRASASIDKMTDMTLTGLMMNIPGMLPAAKKLYPKKVQDALGRSIIRGLKGYGIIPEVNNAIREGVTNAAEQVGFDPNAVPIPDENTLARIVRNYTDYVRENTKENFDPEALSNRIIGVMTEESIAFIPTLALMYATSGLTPELTAATKLGPKIPTLFTKLGLYSGIHAVTQDGDWDDHLFSGAGMTFFGFVNSKTIGLPLKNRIGATIATAQAITSASFLKQLGESKYNEVFNADSSLPKNDINWGELGNAYLEETLVNTVQGLGLLFTDSFIYPRKIVRDYMADKKAAGKRPSLEGLMQERLPMIWDKYNSIPESSIKDKLVFQAGKLDYDLGKVRAPGSTHPFMDDLRAMVRKKDEDIKDISIESIISRLSGGKKATKQTKGEAKMFVKTIQKLDREYLIPKTIGTKPDDKLIESVGGIVKERISRTEDQIKAYAGKPADDKLYAAPVEIPLSRRAYKSLLGDDFEPLILGAMKGKMDATTQSLIINHYLRPSDNTPHEIAILEKQLGWGKDEYTNNSQFNSELGVWWEAQSEANHLLNHKETRGKYSEYKSYDQAVKTAQVIWNNWTPEQRIRAEYNIEVIDNYVRTKLLDAAEEGIINPKVLEKLHSRWKPRVNSEMLDHIAARTTQNEVVKPEASKGKNAVEGPLKTLSNNPEVDDIKIISDPLVNMRLMIMDINTAIEKNGQAKRLHTWIKEHPDEAAEINFHLKRPNSRSEWREVTFNNPEGKNGKSSIWMTSHDYQMLGYEPIVTRQSKFLENMNDKMTWMKHLTTKNEVTFAIRRWLADTRNTVENVRLPMPLKWTAAPGFEAALAKKQLSYIKDITKKNILKSPASNLQYYKDFNEGIKNGLLLSSRGEYSLRGYKDLSKQQINLLIKNIEGANGSKSQVVSRTWTNIMNNPALKLPKDVAKIPQQINEIVHQTASVGKYAMFRDYLKETYPSITQKEIAARLNEHQDFKTHGDAVPLMESVVWFTNPMLRDVGMAFRKVRRDPKAFAKAGLAMMPAVAAHEVAMSISNPAYREIGVGKKVMGVYVPLPFGVKEDDQYKMPSIRLPLDNFGKPIIVFNYLARLSTSMMINELVKDAHAGAFSPDVSRRIFDAFGPKVIDYDFYKDSQAFAKDVIAGGVLNQLSRVNPAIAAGIIGMTKVDPMSGRDYSLESSYLTELGVGYDPRKLSTFADKIGQNNRNLFAPEIVEPFIGLANYNTVAGTMMRLAGNDPKRTRQESESAQIYHELATIAPFNLLLRSVNIDSSVKRLEISEQNSPYIRNVVHPMLMAGDEMHRGNYDKAAELFGNVYDSSLAPVDKKMVVGAFQEAVSSDAIYSGILDYAKTLYSSDYMATFGISEDYKTLKLLKQDLTREFAAKEFIEEMKDKNSPEEKALLMVLGKHSGLFNERFMSIIGKSEEFKEQQRIARDGYKIISKGLRNFVLPKYKEHYQQLGKYSKYLKRDLNLDF
jgi:hypothetical protein